uniref:Uncharacterized protein n=1 Tax=Aegilops tauschii subsp. strangulata TaxID=200361 RepID=A0A453IY33_AEGTS
RFLGHFQPQQGKPPLWKLDSDQHYNIGRQGTLSEETGRFIKRSLSDGNILCENSAPVSDRNVGENNTASELLPSQQLDDIREPTDSAPEIYMCETNPCPRSVSPCSIFFTFCGEILVKISPWRTSACP